MEEGSTSIIGTDQQISVNPYGTTVYSVTDGGTVYSRAVTVLSPVTLYGDQGSNSDELVFFVLSSNSPISNPNVHYEWKPADYSVNNDTITIPKSTTAEKCYVTVTLGNCSVSDSTKIDRVKKAIQHCDAATVTDHEGNIYNVVAFENTYNFDDPAHNNDLTQCWTKENMRAVTSPSTGSFMVRVVNRYEPVSWTGKIAAWPKNDSSEYAPMNYGVLYNWNAALDVYHRGYDELSVNNSAIRNINFVQDFPRGICPLGWHVARSSEWTAVEAPLANRTFAQLESYSGPRSVNSLGNKMATGIWSGSHSSCQTADNNCSYRNTSDLSVLPAGTNNDAYVNAWAYFWTSESPYYLYSGTPYYTYASHLQFNGDDSGPTHGHDNKQINMSVRCVKDYDDSYTKPARVIYYYKNTNNQFAGLGIETNPDPNKEILYRGVLYGSQSQSQDLYFDSNLSLPDGAKYKIHYPASDTIMEIQWGSTSEHPSLGTLFRPVFIYTDGTVDYGLDWIYSNN